MIKEAIEKILDLKRPEFVSDKSKREYMLKGYTEVKPSLPSGFATNSLDSIIDYINQNFDKNENGFVIHVADHETVVLKSQAFGIWQQRKTFISANAQYPEFSFGRYYSQEDFIISMLTKFKATDGSDYCIAIASGIVEGEESTLIDDGMSQTVTMQRGIKAKVNEKVNPYVSMQPYRTFNEIEQPKSVFLLRLKEGARLAIFEADGGAWKKEAIENIVRYFDEMLDDDKYSILF